MRYCVVLQMREAREFYSVPSSPRPWSGKARPLGFNASSADADRELCGPGTHATAEERPRHAARRRLQLDANVNGIREQAAGTASSREGTGARAAHHGVTAPTFSSTSAADGHRAAAGSAVLAKDLAASTRQPASAAPEKMPTMLRRRTGVPVAAMRMEPANGFDGGQAVSSDHKALILSPTAGTARSGSGQAPGTTMLQHAPATKGPPSTCVDAILGTASAASPLPLQLPVSFADGAAEPSGLRSWTPLDRNAFLDAGSAGADSPGSSDAEGPIGDTCSAFLARVLCRCLAGAHGCVACTALRKRLYLIMSLRDSWLCVWLRPLQV